MDLKQEACHANQSLPRLVGRYNEDVHALLGIWGKVHVTWADGRLNTEKCHQAIRLSLQQGTLL